MSLTDPDVRFFLIRLFTNPHLHIAIKAIENMLDFRLRQRVFLQIYPQLVPIQAPFLAASIYPFESHLTGLDVKCLYVGLVSTDTIILVMASEFGSQYLPL